MADSCLPRALSKPRRRSRFTSVVLAAACAGLGLNWLPRAGLAQDTAVQTEPGPASAAEIAEMQGVAKAAWDDAIATWERLIPDQAAAVADAHLSFVDKVTPQLCYGLYAGAGPVYCSGNNTVFVGIAEMRRLSGKFLPLSDVGLSVLIGHEIGHHIQRIHGRFSILSAYVRQQPKRRQEWIRRFELEADCLAGIWIRESDTFGVMQQRRIEVVAALRLIGDDTLQRTGVIDTTPLLHLHGTADERVAAFTRGLTLGSLDACDEFRGIRF